MSYIQAGASGGSGGGRTTLTMNTNYYVTTTGSDSNNGSIGSPWATLQHAINVISSTIDFAGFTVMVNIGVGSFAGCGVKSCVGGGLLFFQGAGSGSTSITGGPNDGFYNFGECLGVNVSAGVQIAIDGVTLVGPTGISAISLGVSTNLFLGNPAFTEDLTFSLVNDSAIYANFSQITTGNITNIKASSPIVPGAFGLMQLNNYTWFEDNGGFNIIGPLTTPAAVSISGFSFYLLFGSWTGGFTGAQYRVVFSADLLTFGFTFGGSSPGKVDSSSSVDGIPGSNNNYQVPLTGFTITLANTDTDVTLDPAGTLATGTITMQPAPIDGQRVTIRSSHTVTALTISPNAGQSVASPPTTIVAGGASINAIYNASNTTWYF